MVEAGRGFVTDSNADTKDFANIEFAPFEEPSATGSSPPLVIATRAFFENKRSINAARKRSMKMKALNVVVTLFCNRLCRYGVFVDVNFLRN